MTRSAGTGGWSRFYRVIARIPPGRVATYGQISALAGLPRHARQVGYALAALPDDSDLPWQRVVNARGEVSPRGGADLGRSGFQRHLLEEEGVVFDLSGRIDLERFRWRPRVARAAGSRRTGA
ncbi:MAG: MGMT family protein [Thermoanaerobaculia bacterium]